jgi:hypothetical protein
MTADTVTWQRVHDLLADTEAACETLRRLRLAIARGQMDPAEAAAIINETIENLTNEAR